MNKKKILVVCPGPILPIKMGSQIRMYNIIKGLSRDHIVDVIAKVSNNELSSKIYTDEMLKICENYIPIIAPNKKNIVNRIYYKVKKNNSLPNCLYYNSIPLLINKISNIANKKKYNIINCEYWYSCSFYNQLTYKPFFALDTHDINFEKYKFKLESSKWGKKRKKIEKYREFELKYTGLNDLIISVSENDYQFFKKTFPKKNHIKIPIGQNLTSYLNYKSSNKHKKTIIFYGNMSSIQNIDACSRLINNILPIIKSSIPEVKLIILGANPPEKIKKLHNNRSIIVTGFVKDIHKWIAEAAVMILPLQIAAGFRTRVVEVMAMGVPVIGTHNALDCIEIVNGMHGYIADSNEKMASLALKLLNDKELKTNIGNECKKFVQEKYSIEATYGKLSKYYIELEC